MKPGAELVLNMCLVAITLGAVAGAGVKLRDLTFEKVAADRVTVIDDWHQYLDGARIGSASARVIITLFLDYTCPHSRDAMAAALEVVHERPENVAIVIRHFPLSNGTARDAAIAAECSRRSGVFRRFHESLFASVDSLGQKIWGRLASDSGISDTLTFATCMDDSTAMAVVGRDLRDGLRLGVSRTPAFLINDWFFEGNPPLGFLRKAVADRSRAVVVGSQDR